MQKTLLEKYFPQTWDDIKLPTKIKKLVTEMQQQSGYRLLMYGSPGSGKTTCSRILNNDPEKYEVLYLSGSNDFKVEVFRNKVLQFASGFSVLQKQKTIIIDECENIRNDLQDAFKIILDQSKSVNFIFITNEIEKVNTAIRSRCTCIEFDFVGDDLKDQQRNFMQYAINICKAENIEYDNEGIKKLYIQYFPDFRHLLVILQQLKDSNLSITLENIKSLNENGKQLVDLYELATDISIQQKDFYESLSKYKGKERECFSSLGEPFFEYLNDKNMYDKTLQAAVIISKYSQMYVTSINKFVTFVSCLVELKTIFR